MTHVFAFKPLRNTRGQVAVVTALVLLPLLIALGLAVDSSRQVNTKDRLQRAIDIAALTGARALQTAGKTDLDIENEITAAFTENMSSAPSDVTCEDPAVLVDRAKEEVTVDGVCAVPTLFGVGISGKAKMDVAASATAEGKVNNVDLALALDLSGSMGGARRTALIRAVEDLADELITRTAGDTIRIGFAGYSTGVNAGPYGNLALGRPENDDSDRDGQNRVCVAGRFGPERTTDAPPDTLTGQFEAPHLNLCPVRPTVHSLNRNVGNIKAHLNRLDTGSYTSGHVGVAWAWYLLSPKWKNVWPAASRPLAYGGTDVIKAVILMSDGQFNYVTSPHDMRFSSNRLAQDLCQEMRKKGILIFSVAYDLDPAYQAVLQNCAGDPNRFYDVAAGGDLSAVYTEIGRRLKATVLKD
ncbi:MAG: pilus assembly protein TadG-related protein [Pseudomonadota bacterium]